MTARLSSRKFALLFAAACATGCGYHVAGRGDRLPPDVKTIAVPTFTNQTKRFRIEQQFTAAVVREFIEATHYRVVAEPENADAVVQGTVKNIATGVIAFNQNTGAATALQVVVTANVRMVDQHTHKVLFSNPRYIFREEYQISQNNSQLFEEEGPALERLSRDFAHTLVTDILENF